MTIHVIIAVAALVLAAMALMTARRAARQLAQLTDLYWRLKYDHGELKSQVAPAPPQLPVPTTAFVPLAQVKRPNPSP